MSGKTRYNMYRKAHGKVLKVSEHPALYGDKMVDLPEFEDLPERERNAWSKIDKTEKTTKKK